MGNSTPRIALPAATLAAVMVSGLGHAAQLQGSLGVSSDNVFRGLSLSDSQPSLFGDIHGLGTHWFGGLAGDSVRLYPYSATEAQVIGYVGYQQPLDADLSLALTGRHYDYPGYAQRWRYDYDEFSATLSWREKVSLQLIGSPDTYAAAGYRYGRGRAYVAEASADQPLPWGLSLGLGLGYYDLRQQIGAGYAYWNVGLSKQWDAWTLTLSYIGTDGTAQRLFGDLAGQRAVASLLWSF